MSEASEPQVLVRVDGEVGRLTLNRPKALHALTLPMCQIMTEALTDWWPRKDMKLILLDHSGERGFCAGGDIRMLAESGAGDGMAAREFFFTEYRLNDLLFRHPIWIVAFMDGVTMGGGVGLAAPCHYRVATERTLYAMPETGIGLFPDVGGGWHLKRMPGQIGLWLALTGSRIKAADCKLAGIAPYYVESAKLEALKAAIVADPDKVEDLLAEYGSDPGPAPLEEHLDELNRVFSGDSVEEIVANLEASDDPWSKQQLATMMTKSPQTLKVAFRQLKLGGECETFAENMAMEYRIGARAVCKPDFIEGVRSVIVDKDNKPLWNPPTLDGVTEEMVDEFFAPLPPAEEWRPIEEEPA